MALIAEYAIGYEDLPLVDVARAVPEATLTLEMVATAEGNPPFVVEVNDGPAEAVEDAFEETPFVGEYDRIAAGGDVPRYKVLPGTSMGEQLTEIDDLQRLRGLAGTDSIVDEIRVTRDGWVQTGWFADLAVFDEFREFWQSEGVQFTVHRLIREDGRYRVGDAEDGLTDRQREAVRAAYRMGYFEIPRKVSLDDVADELDISAPSLSERLRRAQSRLVETTVDLDERRTGSLETPKQ
jgi:DNA-directed RNA polymerase specialized sigma24 family protein